MARGHVGSNLPRPGDTFGPFRILGALGAGGMGLVYRAFDPSADREVALKVIRNVRTDAQRARFAREGAVTALLQHPGIVRVHSAGEVGEVHYLAYELIEGARSLTEACQELDRDARVALVRDAARALGAAHARGIVHRDVKPDNVLVDADGRVKVADFGLAAATDLERLTQTGAVLGTPLYMAPEQYAGDQTRLPHTDVWALGVLLYEVLTDDLPFEGGSMAELMATVMDGKLLSPRVIDPSVTPALEAVCLQALSVEPRDRYPDGEAFAQDLDAALAGEPVSAALPSRWRRLRRQRKWLALALPLGVLFLAALVPLASERGQPPPSTSLASDAPADSAGPESPRRLPGWCDGLEQTALTRLERVWGAQQQALAYKPIGLARVGDTLISVESGHTSAQAVSGRLRTPGSARVWDPGSGEELSWHRLGDELVTFAVSPDETLLATGDESGRVEVWSLPAWTRVATAQLPDTKLILSLAFAPTGMRLLAGVVLPGQARRLALFVVDLASDEQSKRLDDFRAGAWLDEDRVLAWGGSELLVWTVATGETRVLSSGWTTSVSLVSGGQHAVCVSAGNHVETLDLETGAVLGRAEGTVWGDIAVHPGERTALLARFGASGKRELTTLDLLGHTFGRGRRVEDGAMGHLALHGDRVFGFYGRRIRAHDFELRDRSPRPSWLGGPVLAVAEVKGVPLSLSHSGAWLWHDDEPRRQLHSAATFAATSPRGEHGLLSVVWNATRFSLADPQASTVGVGRGWLRCAAIADTGRVVASIHSGLSVGKEGEGWRELVEETDALVVVAAFPPGDETTFATGDEAGGVAMWDLERGVQTSEATEHQAPLTALVFGGGGSLYSGDRDGQMVAWTGSSTLEPVGRFSGHEGVVTALAVTPDLLVSASQDATVRLWDRVSGRELDRIPFARGDFPRSLFVHEGRLLVGTQRGFVLRFALGSGSDDLAEALPARVPPGFAGVGSHGARLTNVWGRTRAALTGTGTDVAVLGDELLVAENSMGDNYARGVDQHVGEGLVRRFDLGSGRARGVLRVPGPGLRAIEATPDGRLLATLSQTTRTRQDASQVVHLWSWPEGEQVGTLGPEVGKKLTEMAVSPDGSKLAVTGEDLTVWELPTGRLVHRIEGSQGYCVAWLPDGRRVVTAQRYGGDRVVLWDLETKQALFEGHAGGPAMDLEVSPDGALALTASWQPAQLRLFDLRAGRELKTIPTPGATHAVATLSDDWKRCAVTVRQRAYVYDLETGKQIAREWVDAGSRALFVFDRLPDGRLVGTGTVRNVQVFDHDLAPDPRWGRRVAAGPALAVAADQEQVVSINAARGWRWFGEGGGEIVFRVGGDHTRRAAFSAEGLQLLLANGRLRAELHLFDSRTGYSALGRIERPGSKQVDIGVPAALALTDSAQRGAVALQDGTLWIFDTPRSAADTVRWRALEDDGQVEHFALAFAARSETILYAGDTQGTLRAWDAATETLVTTRQHQEAITAIASSGRGLVASGDLAGAVYLWSDQAKLVPGPQLVAHDGVVTALAVAGLDHVWSAGDDGALRRWNARGEPIDRLELPDADFARSLDLSAGGETLVVGTQRGLVLRFDLR